MPTILQSPPEIQEKIEEIQEQKTKREETDRKKSKFVLRFLLLFSALLVICCGILLDKFFFRDLFEPSQESKEETLPAGEKMPEWVSVHFIRLDGVSRRGEALEGVRDIVVHYVANPGTSAMANRNYFDNPESETSSHFIIGLEGEVIMCVPLSEKSSATGERNRDTISIEVCHPDATGEFCDATTASLLRLLAYLMDRYDLSKEHIIRHYDVTGKLCPLYYVENPKEWEALKDQAERLTEKEKNEKDD